MDLFDLNIGLVIQPSSENSCGVIVEYPSNNVSSFYNLKDRQTFNKGLYFSGFDFRMFNETLNSLNYWDVVFYDICDDDAINIKKLSDIENEVLLKLKKKGQLVLNLDYKFDQSKRVRLDKFFKKTLLMLHSRKYQRLQYKDRFELTEKEFDNANTFANQVNIDNYLNDYKIQFNFGFDYTITHYRKESSTFSIGPFCAFQNNYVFDYKDGVETQRQYKSAAYQVVDNRRLELKKSDGYLMNLFFFNISLKKFDPRRMAEEVYDKLVATKLIGNQNRKRNVGLGFRKRAIGVLTSMLSGNQIGEGFINEEDFKRFEKEYNFSECVENNIAHTYQNENMWLKTISKDYDINSRIEYSINLLEDRPDAYHFHPFNLDKFINFKTKTDIDFDLASEISMKLTSLKKSQIKSKYSLDDHLKFNKNINDNGVNEVHRIIKMNIKSYIRESLRSISKYPVRVKNRGKYSTKWIDFDFRYFGL